MLRLCDKLVCACSLRFWIVPSSSCAKKLAIQATIQRALVVPHIRFCLLGYIFFQASVHSCPRVWAGQKRFYEHHFRLIPTCLCLLFPKLFAKAHQVPYSELCWRQICGESLLFLSCAKDPEMKRFTFATLTKSKRPSFWNLDSNPGQPGGQKGRLALVAFL